MLKPTGHATLHLKSLQWFSTSLKSKTEFLTRFYTTRHDPAQLLLWPRHSALSRWLTPLICTCLSAATQTSQTCSHLRAFAPAVLAIPSRAHNSFLHFKTLIKHQLPPSSFLYPLCPYLLYFSPWNNTAWHTKYFLVYLFIGCLFFNIYVFGCNRSQLQPMGTSISVVAWRIFFFFFKFQHARSLVVTFKLLVVARGSSSLTRDWT